MSTECKKKFTDSDFYNHYVMLYNEMEELKTLLCEMRDEIKVYQQNSPKRIGKMLAIAESSLRIMKKCDKLITPYKIADDK